MTTTRWTDAFLDDMRKVADPRADDVIATLFAEGEVAHVNALFKTLVENDEPVPRHLPPVVGEYFSQTEGLPDWSDEKLLAKGEEVFMAYGLHIVAALFFSSLPECYAGAKGAHALAITARLSKRPYRRIVETAQFIIDTMSPGGLGPEGAGIRSAQKVRLMHAAVRHMCNTQPHWDPTWGKPINQEDLAGTLMTFSTVVLDALHRLGLDVEPAQQEAYFHTWRNVGHLLGIDARLIPRDVADGRDLMNAIRRRQHAGSPVGVELTTALVKFMEHVVPGTLFDPVPGHLIRYLVGDEVADMLELPSLNALERMVLAASAALEHLVDLPLRHFEEMDRLFEVFNHKVFEGLLLVTRGDSRPPFRIPSSLRRSWGLHVTAGGSVRLAEATAGAVEIPLTGSNASPRPSRRPQRAPR
jgi:uncharacterized protein (DUF2236 family)